jgi:hypothetical protein
MRSKSLEAAQKIRRDARVLFEPRLAAMWAGDPAKARKMDEQAIRASVDPKLKASGLYNLGLVQEKSRQRRRSRVVRRIDPAAPETAAEPSSPPIAPPPAVLRARQETVRLHAANFGDLTRASRRPS